MASSIAINASIAGSPYTTKASLADTDAARILTAFQNQPGGRNAKATWTDLLKFLLNGAIRQTSIMVQTNEQTPPPAPPVVTVQ